MPAEEPEPTANSSAVAAISRSGTVSTAVEGLRTLKAAVQLRYDGDVPRGASQLTGQPIALHQLKPEVAVKVESENEILADPLDVLQRDGHQAQPPSHGVEDTPLAGVAIHFVRHPQVAVRIDKKPDDFWMAKR